VRASPLLASIARHVLDEQWKLQRRHPLGTLDRHADDLVVLCHTGQRTDQDRERVAAILAPLRLQVRSTHGRSALKAIVAATLVNVALPHITDDFDASVTALQWVLTG
jgi:hypothetical protein